MHTIVSYNLGQYQRGPIVKHLKYRILQALLIILLHTWH